MPNAQNQVREAAAREYRSKPALQSEFISEAAYVAYCCAMDRGAARISPATARYFENPKHATHPGSPAAPRVEPGYGPDSGVGGGVGGFVNSGEFASKLGPIQWACPVSDATLKVALGLMQSGETRLLGCNAVDQLIAKRAGVGLDVAGVARSMARRIKGQP